MMSFAEYHRKKMEDPEFKRDYDALEGWFQEELAAQETSERHAEQTDTHRKGKQPLAPHVSFA